MASVSQVFWKQKYMAIHELDRSIFCVWFFRLLSSFLLLLVVTQCFSCCIFQPSSSLPCLPGYRNDSTREIIFKLWLLIIQEIWRCYTNNDIIVFHTYQFEKYHKTFLEKSHEMNLKCKIQWYQRSSTYVGPCWPLE